MKKIIISAFIGILAMVNVFMFTQNKGDDSLNLSSLLNISQVYGSELDDWIAFADEFNSHFVYNNEGWQGVPYGWVHGPRTNNCSNQTGSITGFMKMDLSVQNDNSGSVTVSTTGVAVTYDPGDEDGKISGSVSVDLSINKKGSEIVCDSPEMVNVCESSEWKPIY